MSDTFQRLHRIASALYLITSFFPEQEPLKWRLRGYSDDLVSDAVKDKFFVVKEINALFALAKDAGLVSETNYSILSREVTRLGQDTENPLNAMLSRETPSPERSLPRPAPAPEIKDNIPEIHPKPAGDRPVLREYGAVSVKKNSRQSIIIGLLKRKREIMIKDVSPLISGCSEKTIQRELSDMVSKGILKKIGEKRWSRYSLA